MNDRDEREALELMRTTAKMARGFYDELLTQGFEHDDALELTHTWLAAHWSPVGEDQ